MLSLRLVFLAMVISMTLSKSVFGGESPNDRISTILAVMTSISERVDKLVGKVGNMESKVNNIDQTEQLTAEKVSKIEDRMDSMDTKMASVSNEVDSMDTKIDKVDQDVKMNGWMYLGRGYIIGDSVEESGTSGTTLSQCCQICEEKHSADHQWNGFLWNTSDGYCWCEKKDQGNDPKRFQEYFMHFLKQ